MAGAEATGSTGPAALAATTVGGAVALGAVPRRRTRVVRARNDGEGEEEGPKG